jgi:hypothetical protein
MRSWHEVKLGVIEQRQLDLLAEGGYLGLANSRRECPKKAPLGGGAERGVEMRGAVSNPPLVLISK